MIGETVAWVRYVVLRLMLKGSPKSIAQSIELSDLIDDGSTDRRFAQVGAALRLIARTDPRRFERLRRDVRRIVFLETGPEFWRRGRVCVLHDVSDLSVAEVALHVVHEATHARLLAAGVPYSSAVRDRVEAVCVRQELEFLRLLPGEKELAEHTRTKLDQRWWSPRALRERHAETLRTANAPRWFVRLYQWTSGARNTQ